MDEITHTPEEVARWFRNTVKEFMARKGVLEWLRENAPECIHPDYGVERTESLIAEHFNDAGFNILEMTDSQLLARLERIPKKWLTGQKSRTRKRGNKSDKTTKVDLACDHIRANPNDAERLSSADLAKIVNCSPSLLSRKKNKMRIEAAKAQAGRASRDMARGFSTDDHQADAEYIHDWDAIRDTIDSDS